jgi:GlpG protein
MTEVIDIEQSSTDDSFKKYIPVVTAGCCLISIVLFVGINFEGNLYSWEVYKKWGSPSLTDIFAGSYWGLVTSNFLHTELWHIAFNLYWLWIFGKKIEFESSKSFFVLLILSSALVSSLSQLSFGDTTGIGLSGIGYSLFGFIFVKSRTSEDYKDYLDQRTKQLFLFWLVICFVLTQTKTWNVGNAAHVGGLLWGIFLAYISNYDYSKQWVFGVSFVAVLASSIFWNPFSVSWLSHKAYELHKNQKVDEAITVYQEILNRDPDNGFAKANLEQIEVFKLQKKALELHASQKYEEARQVYLQILRIDLTNQWARDNLKLLPVE